MDGGIGQDFLAWILESRKMRLERDLKKLREDSSPSPSPPASVPTPAISTSTLTPDASPATSHPLRIMEKGLF
ncbi:hypothetical protein ACFX12_021380 [Malus domestica]